MGHFPSPWVVILAGGDGRRLHGAIVDGHRLDRPKQFCRLRGETLLQRTLRRSLCITALERTVVVVRDDHRHWWQEELRHLPEENILIEPANRGTAVAILNAVLHVLRRDIDPVLLFLPSDHSAEHESVLVASATTAARLAATRREHLVLLGISPDAPETDYGWILPGRREVGAGRMVEHFVEKPPARLALELHGAGALWNSFIFAGSALVLLDLFRTAQPGLVSGYLEWLGVHGSREPGAKGRFLALPSVDFCREILMSAGARLRVLAVPRCGWTDLGTPGRLQDWLERGVPVTPSQGSPRG